MTVTVVGSCNLDLIVEVARLPVPGETVLGGDLVRRPGGKGANQAVAARRLGADTTFVGAVGDDDFGATVRAALDVEGIDVSRLATVPGPTGVALIVVDAQAENVITVAPGANHAVTIEGLTTAPGDVLLLQLEIPLATAAAAAIAARNAGATVVVNAAPLPDPRDAVLRGLLAVTDVLIVNEGEAASLGPARPEELRALGPSTVIVTLGPAGAMVADAAGRFAVPGLRVDAVDTTGAGDAFCGAVAASLVARRPVRDAVRRGCAAGALATTAIGAQPAMPTAGQVERLLGAVEVA